MTSGAKGRCLGLIGGLGVGAAVHYYVNIAKAHHAEGRTLDLVMAHAEPPRVMEFVLADDRKGLAGYLNGYIERMKAAGAEFAVVPAVTPHFGFHELAAISPLPIIDIFGPLKQEIARRGLKRVAVLGTRFVTESNFYGEVPEVDFVRPQPGEVDRIHEIYTTIALSGTGTAEQHTELTAIAHTLIERDKAEAIVLGGTDLALLFNKTTTDFPCLDCGALHIRAIVQAMLE
jgi:aspartate racemase